MQGGYADVSDLGAPGGTPMTVWVKAFRYAYSTNRLGVVFNGWANGQPTEKQPQVMLEVFDIMRDETIAVLNESAQER